MRKNLKEFPKFVPLIFVDRIAIETYIHAQRALYCLVPYSTMITIPTGLLKGQTLRDLSEPDLRGFAAARDQHRLENASFYRLELENLVFRGVIFSNCSFARSTFKKVSFRSCRFERVDLTRTVFQDCYFSDCDFNNCDPYYAKFEKTELDPSALKMCYLSDSDWNKALLLFSGLRKEFQEMGETDLAREADYFFKIWHRRRLYIRWRYKQNIRPWPWLWSVFQASLNGYGERPAYLGLWMAGVVTTLAGVYMKWFPNVVTSEYPAYREYWFFSFRVLFGQGFFESASTLPAMLLQVTEFGIGLVLVTLLIASVARKLAP